MAMNEPTFNADGYPTEDTLKEIETWDYRRGFHGLMKFVQKAWNYPNYWSEEEEWYDAIKPDGSMWKRQKTLYRISTGGWSGNGMLIEAMEGNWMFWNLCWVSSRRGGHYEFDVRVIETAGVNPYE